MEHGSQWLNAALLYRGGRNAPAQQAIEHTLRQAPTAAALNLKAALLRRNNRIISRNFNLLAPVDRALC